MAEKHILGHPLFNRPDGAHALSLHSRSKHNFLWLHLRGLNVLRVPHILQYTPNILMNSLNAVEGGSDPFSKLPLLKR